MHCEEQQWGRAKLASARPPLPAVSLTFHHPPSSRRRAPACTRRWISRESGRGTASVAAGSPARAAETGQQCSPFPAQSTHTFQHSQSRRPRCNTASARQGHRAEQMHRWQEKRGASHGFGHLDPKLSRGDGGPTGFEVPTLAIAAAGGIIVIVHGRDWEHENASALADALALRPAAPKLIPRFLCRRRVARVEDAEPRAGADPVGAVRSLHHLRAHACDVDARSPRSDRPRVR